MKAGLGQLTSVPTNAFPPPRQIDSDPDINEMEEETYLSVIQGDVVAKARQLVSGCRASGQRREDFAKTIQDGNISGEFNSILREVVLLRDMDVRWSSTFLMIDRVLELYPVSPAFYFCFEQLSLVVNFRPFMSS